MNSKLRDRDSFTTEELKPFLVLPGEEISPVTIRTRLNALKRSGVITPVGRGLFTLKKLHNYTPEIDQSLREVYLMLKKQLPLTRICVWKPSWLNEFALHIASIQTIVVEAQREAERAVFEVLQEVLKKNSSLTENLLLQILLLKISISMFLVSPLQYLWEDSLLKLRSGRVMESSYRNSRRCL
jgi:hypothetical protein